MFSTAGSSGSSWPDWKTKPKALRRSLVRAASGMAVRFAPRKVTVPAVGRMMPASACSRVDLPEPEGPMTATDSPSRRVKSTWLSASVCTDAGPVPAVPWSAAARTLAAP